MKVSDAFKTALHVLLVEDDKELASFYSKASKRKAASSKSVMKAARVCAKFEIEQTLATRKGSRTLAIDAQNRRIYMPAAEFLPVTTGWPKV